MKSLLARFPLRRVLGVYLGEEEIVVSQVAATLAGPVQTAMHRHAMDGENLRDVLPKALQPFVAGKRRPPLTAIGLPASRVFFGTRSVRGASETSSQLMLQRMLCSSSIRIDDYVIDVIRKESGKTPLACMAACHKKYLGGILSALGQCGVRPFRAEPGPCGLVRAAVRARGCPRRAKRLLRVVLGTERGMAVLMAGDLPLTWRSFELPHGQELPAVFCALRTFQSLASCYGMEGPIEAILIHGRPDLHPELRESALAKDESVTVVLCPEPALDGEAIAFGLALGCLGSGQLDLDFSRSLKPPPSFREIFPWGDLVFQGAAIGCMGLFLLAASRSVASACEATKAENARHAVLQSASLGDLQKKKQDLFGRVDAIRRFLGTRVIWSEYTHDLAERLPKQAQLNSIYGLCQMEYMGKKKEGVVEPKKSLILHVGAPLSSDGLIPREIDTFLGSLRNHPLLKRDFPLVDLADIKRYQLHSKAAPQANFTVICLPKSKIAPAAAPAEPGGEKTP